MSSIQELCTEAGRYRRLFESPLCPAVVLVTRSCYHLCLPADFTERQGINMNRPTWRNHSPARAAEARGQPSVGSSRKELLHEKLGTSCFLPQGLSQCLC